MWSPSIARRGGHALHFWDLAAGTHLQRVDLGAQHQMVLELRPAHDPEATWGFVGVVVSTQDLSASVWRWHRAGGGWAADKVITIPAEPADPDLLPPALKPFSAVPPLITDINLSVDDQQLYVSCFGTGELKQYDVSDPAHPRETASVCAWMTKIDTTAAGGLSVDKTFFPHGPDFRGLRIHQVRLQGGDASSDSYCSR
ncbi:MAG: selenium-binding protein SBP56-related protein [Pseudonocardiaceae bacterium]